MCYYVSLRALMCEGRKFHKKTGGTSMCRVHKRRSRENYGWRESREAEEDGTTRLTPGCEVDVDPTVPEEVGGIVVDTPVDIEFGD